MELTDDYHQSVNTYPHTPLLIARKILNYNLTDRHRGKENCAGLYRIAGVVSTNIFAICRLQMTSPVEHRCIKTQTGPRTVATDIYALACPTVDDPLSARTGTSELYSILCESSRPEHQSKSRRSSETRTSGRARFLGS